mmetsp:Transcript_30430/g.83876  ORF Transcript_30430/g.83876 Transcript_30430/m.83876 type:complete len:623 (-) Transcript_30430:165-2033(-)
MVMHHFVEERDEYDYGAQPNTVQRHCTDIPCCLAFLVALAGFAYITVFGIVHGNPRRFLHLPNSRGDICGTDGMEDRPFLYFCNNTNGLHVNNTMCVEACPKGGDTLVHTCPDGAVGPGSYATRELFGILCAPDDPKEFAKFQHKSILKNPQVRQALRVTEVVKNWKALTIVAVCAVVLGFLFCFFLETCAFCIFWGSLGFVILVVASLGGYLIYESRFRQTEGLESLQQLPELTTGNIDTDFIIGIVACVVAFLVTCGACCGCGVVNTALESLKEAADCITDIPSLLVQPFVDLAIKIIVFIALVVGFWYILSTAQMEHNVDKLGEYELKYENQEYFFIAYYILMAYWILELVDAMSNFCIAYAVQLWFAYTRGGLESSSEAPCFPTLQGLLAGVTFHLGTFAEGSFIIALVRGARDFMFLVTKQATDTGNATVACCSCCCTMCLDCFNRFLKFMTKNAYMDTAMNSNDFCKAAHHAATVLLTHAGEVATLNTTTVLFQIAGISGIAAGGVAIMHLMCEYWDELNNPESEAHVENRVTLYAVAGVLSAFISLPFMTLLDQVSDTLLFCNCIEKKRTPPPPVYQDDPEYEKQSALLCGCCSGRPPPARDPGMVPERRALITG